PAPRQRPALRCTPSVRGEKQKAPGVSAKCSCRLVVAIGPAPTTPTMSRWCSNQLSYAPKVVCGAPDWKAVATQINGRRGGIRTRDPLHPMQVRYQAALHADKT